MRWYISFIGLLLSACNMTAQPPETIIITATFSPSAPQIAAPTIGVTAPALAFNPTAQPIAALGVDEYTVRGGDTLTVIATLHNTTVDELIALNGLTDPDLLEVGQVLQLPAPPSEYGSALLLLPDSRMVRAPGSAAFDVSAFIAAQPGFIRTATDTVNGRAYTAATLVQRAALEYSVDPRLLLTLLELKGGWLSNPTPDEERQLRPLGGQAAPAGFSRDGLYRQLAWAADQINRGYYMWKQNRLRQFAFEDGARLLIDPSLNAGSVGVQFFLMQNQMRPAWEFQVSAAGFPQVYARYFGDPFADARDPLVPPDLEQPLLALPFAPDETWFYSGGPHGGWGSGSAWAAVDFAPPDDLETKTTSCYVSEYFVTAVAAGVIARVDEGVVVLDLDGDGDESTGWSILYLHLSDADRVAAGTRVQVGDPIGRPSCDGGFSTGTHLHIARRYNGEWIMAACEGCLHPPFVMSGWRVQGRDNREYQGYLVRNDERRIAEQLRDVADNHVEW